MAVAQHDSLANDSDASATQAPPGDHSRRKLLVVEDDDATRIALSFVLSNAGFDVITARNGQEGLARAMAERFDLILTDLEMPMMDGLRMLGQIRKVGSSAAVPVVVMSNHADRQIVSQAAKLAVRDYVVKSALDVERLVERLRQASASADPPADAPHSPTAWRDNGADPAADQPNQADGAPTGDSKTTRPAAAPYDLDPDAAIDQQAWKQRIQGMGRLSRDQSAAALAQTTPPLMFPAMVKALHDQLPNVQPDDGDTIQSIEQEPALLLGALQAANVEQDSNTDATDIATCLRWIGNAGLGQIVRQAMQLQDPWPQAMHPWAVRWWVHALAVGELAAMIAPSLGANPDVARVAGMLHDIGRFHLLAGELGPRVAACYDAARHMSIPTSFAEQMLLGMNHKAAGLAVCDRARVPAAIASICETHDMEDAQRQSLDKASQPLAAAVNAADNLAKALGYGAMPSDEIAALPAVVARQADAVKAGLGACQAEIDTFVSWRLGANQPTPIHQLVPLSGIVICLLSSRPGALNSYALTLSRAGATVTLYDSIAAFLDSKPVHDVLIFDQTTESVSRVLPSLRRLSSHAWLNDVPRLLLARRSDEPETVLSQAGLQMAVYATPVRNAALLQLIRKLTG